MKYEVSPHDLKAALTALDVTRGKDAQRQPLQCLHAIAGERNIRFATADGFALTRLDLVATPADEDEPGEPVTVLLDWTQGIAMLTAALKDTIARKSRLSCILTVDADGLTLTTPEGLTARLPAQDGYTYPRYEELIPPIREAGTHFQAFNAHQMARILKAIPADMGAGIVRLYMGGETTQPMRLDWRAEAIMSATIVVMPMFVGWEPRP